MVNIVSESHDQILTDGVLQRECERAAPDPIVDF